MEELLGLLSAPKSAADKQSKGVFTTTIGFVPEGITFSPDDGAVRGPSRGTERVRGPVGQPWREIGEVGRREDFAKGCLRQSRRR